MNFGNCRGRAFTHFYTKQVIIYKVFNFFRREHLVKTDCLIISVLYVHDFAVKNTNH